VSELVRPFAVDRIGAGAEITIEATEAECAALAVRLRIPAVHRLRCTYQLHRAPDRIVAEGVLDAQIVQTCIVTLDELAEQVEERFTVHFVGDPSLLDETDPLAPDRLLYEGTSLDLGEAAAEQLALAMDPYPRAPGAALPEAARADADNPFSGLASHKPH